MSKESERFTEDLGIIFLSVVLAYHIAKTGTLEHVLTLTLGREIIGSFIAGLAYSSGFTAPISVVAFGVMAQENSLLLIALVGAFGSMLADMFFFTFARYRFRTDLFYILKPLHLKRRGKFWTVTLPLIGAFIVASPLPDEIGVVLLGISHWSRKRVALLCFVLNFIAINIIGLIAQGM